MGGGHPRPGSAGCWPADDDAPPGAWSGMGGVYRCEKGVILHLNAPLGAGAWVGVWM